MTDHPIDFVVTWVDGNDEAWLEELNQYSPQNSEMNSFDRYRNWCNLEFLFRGFENFTPWVNKILLGVIFC